MVRTRRRAERPAPEGCDDGDVLWMAMNVMTTPSSAHLRGQMLS
jgi:hypothetical protein